MARPVLIAHADGEEELAELLAKPLQDVGYDVVYRGTMLVGESLVAEASKVLAIGGPLVVCGTVKALGTGWAYLLTNAARQHPDINIFAVQMEQQAFLRPLSLDAEIGRYWQDPTKCISELIAALARYYPLSTEDDTIPGAQYAAEQRFRQLTLEQCDIIDLANLPETDRHVATQQLLLRQLYVALRVRVEQVPGTDVGEDTLASIEKRRTHAWTTAEPWKQTEIPDLQDAVRVPVGERLAEARRLVVLGDPGAGKTTMLRWIATSYLLRLKKDPEWQKLPDVSTLPDDDWLPVFIRCRDLDEPQLSGALDDILQHILRKAELSERQIVALRGLIPKKLSAGKALLLVDGLDEIIDPGVRARFCRQLEQIHVAHPNAPIIATSRIVGYREMSHRIGRGFEHVTVAELDRNDKDIFASRWCAVTEPAIRQASATRELKSAIHSTDRIERLTGNPMLLTTMALVKRKVGKLPNRRADLYAEAVQVLLNWRGEVDDPIDQHEALPQLEYVAFGMCDRGVQQLREDELIELFSRMREEYPQVHAVRNHTPAAFLRLLERRTGMLLEAGDVRYRGRPVPVFEFRHLTFQEYLAGLALVDGRIPQRDRSKSLAEQVAPLAGRTSEVRRPGDKQTEVSVVENWREALRLCVMSCNDDDVDDVLRAICIPLPEEDASVTARPRAVLAALCLVDEPNATEAVGEGILRSLAEQTDEHTSEAYSSAMKLATQLSNTRWAGALRRALIDEFIARPSISGIYPAYMCALAIKIEASYSKTAWRALCESIAKALASTDEAEAVEAALTLVKVASDRQRHPIPSVLTNQLLRLLTKSSAVAIAAAYALFWLSGTSGELWYPWRPSGRARRQMHSAIAKFGSDSIHSIFLGVVLAQAGDARVADLLIHQLGTSPKELRRVIIRALGRLGDSQVVEPLIGMLSDPDVSQYVLQALMRLGDSRAVEPIRGLLRGALDDHERDQQEMVVVALAQLGDPDALRAQMQELSSSEASERRAMLELMSRLVLDPVDQELLTERFNGQVPFIDPQEVITEGRVSRIARSKRLPREEILRHYERIAKQLPIQIELQDAATTP